MRNPIHLGASIWNRQERLYSKRKESVTHDKNRSEFDIKFAKMFIDNILDCLGVNDTSKILSIPPILRHFFTVLSSKFKKAYKRVLKYFCIHLNSKYRAKWEKPIESDIKKKFK